MTVSLPSLLGEDDVFVQGLTGYDLGPISIRLAALATLRDEAPQFLQPERTEPNRTSPVAKNRFGAGVGNRHRTRSDDEAEPESKSVPPT